LKDKDIDSSGRNRDKEMVPWNSFPLEVTYEVLGWLAFVSWAVAGYPQLILNFRRKRLFFSCSILISVAVFPLGWILKWFFWLVLWSNSVWWD